MLAVGLAASGCTPVVAVIDTAPADTGGPTACDSTPIVGPDGQPTGFVRCADGVVLRTQAVTGVTTRITEARCADTAGSCARDTDCTAKSVGACLERGIQTQWCECVYACGQDSDCDTGQICLPPGVWDGGPAWGTCVPAQCTTNADCASQECSFTAWNDGCSDVVQLACRTPDDVCRTDADCDPGTARPLCAFDYAGTISCVGPNCDIGRPFTDGAGDWRRAPLAERDDWQASTGDVPGVSAAERALLAEHWCTVGALEHSSVASFARHTLELLALGAPAALLADVQAAAADEVRHAELAYGLATALGGVAVGPGPLDVGDMAPRTDPEAVLEALLREGCLGETFGAAEAALAASRAVAPTRDVLQQIAADEARHAALAWRTVRWLLVAHPGLRPVLDRVVPPPPVPAGPEHALAAHGLIADAERAALHRRVWDTVIAPGLAVLRSSPAGVSAPHVGAAHRV